MSIVLSGSNNTFILNNAIDISDLSLILANPNVSFTYDPDPFDNLSLLASAVVSPVGELGHHLFSIFLIIMTPVGIFGAILLLVALNVRKELFISLRMSFSRSRRNYLNILTVLALIICLITCFWPFYILKSRNPSGQCHIRHKINLPLALWLSFLNKPLEYLIMGLSNDILALMSIETFVAVRYPFFFRNRMESSQSMYSKITIPLLAVYNFMLTFPFFLRFKLIKMHLPSPNSSTGHAYAARTSSLSFVDDVVDFSIDDSDDVYLSDIFGLTNNNYLIVSQHKLTNFFATYLPISITLIFLVPQFCIAVSNVMTWYLLRKNFKRYANLKNTLTEIQRRASVKPIKHVKTFDDLMRVASSLSLHPIGEVAGKSREPQKIKTTYQQTSTPSISSLSKSIMCDYNRLSGNRRKMKNFTQQKLELSSKPIHDESKTATGSNMTNNFPSTGYHKRFSNFLKIQPTNKIATTSERSESKFASDHTNTVNTSWATSFTTGTKIYARKHSIAGDTNLVKTRRRMREDRLKNFVITASLITTFTVIFSSPYVFYNLIHHSLFGMDVGCLSNFGLGTYILIVFEFFVFPYFIFAGRFFKRKPTNNDRQLFKGKPMNLVNFERKDPLPQQSLSVRMDNKYLRSFFSKIPK